MPGFSGGELLANLIFSSIGFVGLVYGKRMHAWTPMLLGLALMTFPYFVSGTLMLWALGTTLCAGLILFRP